MDIKKWIESTKVELRPKEPDDLAYPRGKRAKNGVRVQCSDERKKSSSFIEVASESVRKNKKRRRQNETASISTRRSSSSSQSEFETEPSASETPGEVFERRVFERRKRHTTRKELYDPYSGERKRRGKSTKEKKDTKRSKKCYHKTKRSKKDSRPGNTLIQNFHANNVPRARLTLHPPATLGLFKKGRASSPVRGRGLPDLAFSEMRFLQNSKVSHNIAEAAAGEATGKQARRKRSKAHDEQERISAFFSGKRKPSKDKIRNAPRSGNCNDDLHEHGSERGNPEKSTPGLRSIQPPVDVLPQELPEKSYLTFGSRGKNSNSTIYFPWSQSASRRSSSARILGEATAVEMDDSIEVGLARGSRPIPMYAGLVAPKSSAESEQRTHRSAHVSSNHRSQQPLAEKEPPQQLRSADIVPSRKAEDVAHIDKKGRQMLSTCSPRRPSSPISRLLQACDTAFHGRSGSNKNRNDIAVAPANENGYYIEYSTGPTTERREQEESIHNHAIAKYHSSMGKIIGGNRQVNHYLINERGSAVPYHRHPTNHPGPTPCGEDSYERLQSCSGDQQTHANIYNYSEQHASGLQSYGDIRSHGDQTNTGYNYMHRQIIGDSYAPVGKRQHGQSDTLLRPVDASGYFNGTRCFDFDSHPVPAYEHEWPPSHIESENFDNRVHQGQHQSSHLIDPHGTLELEAMRHTEHDHAQEKEFPYDCFEGTDEYETGVIEGDSFVPGPLEGYLLRGHYMRATEPNRVWENNGGDVEGADGLGTIRFWRANKLY